jgi:competence protein ComEC
MNRTSRLRSPVFLSAAWALSGLFCCLFAYLVLAVSSPGTSYPAVPSIVIPQTKLILPTNTSSIPTVTTLLPVSSPSDTLSTVETVPVSPTQTPTTAPTGVLHVYVLDVGQGLSVLIIAPSGQAALFDGGPTDAGSAVIADLHKYGVERLDLVILSHSHEDHEGGLISVLHTIPVAKIVTNGQPNTTSNYEQFLDAALASNAEYIETALGSSFPLGDLVLQVYSPPAPRPTGDLNHNSLVVRFVYGQHAYLLMGDADQAAEGVILASGLDVQSDVLQPGHHCSSDASGIIFLQAVKPKYAVCSVGAGNPYGHPHAETLQRLLSVSATVFRTDRNGTIAFSSDGTTLSVEAER